MALTAFCSVVDCYIPVSSSFVQEQRKMLSDDTTIWSSLFFYLTNLLFFFIISSASCYFLFQAFARDGPYSFLVIGFLICTFALIIFLFLRMTAKAQMKQSGQWLEHEIRRYKNAILLFIKIIVRFRFFSKGKNHFRLQCITFTAQAPNACVTVTRPLMSVSTHR